MAILLQKKNKCFIHGSLFRIHPGWEIAMKRILFFTAGLSMGIIFLFSLPCSSEIQKDTNQSKKEIQEPDATPELPALQVKAGQLGIVGIHFESGSSEINKCFTAQLNQIATALKTEKLRNAKILIQGHTDDRGSAEYNLKLSRLRAKKVMDIFIKKYNLDPNRLTAEGVGETMPISSNDTISGQAINRRIEFIYMGELDPKNPK